MAHENLIEGYKILRYGYKIIHIRNKYKHPADSKKTLTRYNAEMVSYLRSPSSKIKTNASKENRKLNLKSGIYTTLQLQYLPCGMLSVASSFQCIWTNSFSRTISSLIIEGSHFPKHCPMNHLEQPLVPQCNLHLQKNCMVQAEAVHLDLVAEPSWTYF